jgi:ketosteroid isomerase-like protein
MESQGVSRAVQRFYSALNAMFAGDLEPMKEVWSHADDVTYMGPGGGFRVGWEEVLRDWEAQASMNLGGEVQPKDIELTVGRDLAVVGNYEIGENVGVDGKPQEVRVRATSMFRQDGGKWKMIGHHTDLLPHLQR